MTFEQAKAALNAAWGEHAADGGYAVTSITARRAIEAASSNPIPSTYSIRVLEQNAGKKWECECVIAILTELLNAIKSN